MLHKLPLQILRRITEVVQVCLFFTCLFVWSLADLYKTITCLIVASELKVKVSLQPLLVS